MATRPRIANDVARGGGAAAMASAVVFVAAACVMFGASALYNRVDWQPGALRDQMRPIDHPGVFVMIAAS